jgi:outer membrane murein-binding lipoprotein Lpp
MKRRLDSIIIGGAMLFGGIAHRRADHVSRQVEELGDAIEAVEDQLREADVRAARPPVPGMPLPTGYGLQVRGPDEESIVLPVCLPPGFELASMVLCPEFLPRDAPQQPAAQPVAIPAPAATPAPAPGAPAPAVAGARERFSGTLQYVFGSEPDYIVDESFGGAVDVETARPPRASGIETHHL